MAQLLPENEDTSGSGTVRCAVIGGMSGTSAIEKWATCKIAFASVELGTSARHGADRDIAITLPPDLCWAYRDDGGGAVD